MPPIGGLTNNAARLYSGDGARGEERHRERESREDRTDVLGVAASAVIERRAAPRHADAAIAAGWPPLPRLVALYQLHCQERRLPWKRDALAIGQL